MLMVVFLLILVSSLSNIINIITSSSHLFEGCFFYLSMIYSSLMKKLIIAFFIFCLLISCSVQKPRDTINIALSQEMPTLDVHRNSSQVIRYILCGNTLERLIDLDGEGNVVCTLAESYSQLDGGRTWTFKIKKGILLHNQRELNAEDVALSLNRWIEYYAAIKNIAGDSRFTYQNDEVTIKFSHPVIFFDQIMASSPYAAVILAKESLDQTDDKGFLISYIGTGPYVFDSYISGQSVNLKKFKDYKGDKKAYIENLKYYFVSDSVVRTLGLESGKYDFINDVMSSDFERLKKNDDVVLSLGDEAGSFVLLFNKRGPLGKEQYIRSAVNYALDLNGVMRACYGSQGYTLNPCYMEGWQKTWLIEDLEKYHNINDKGRAKEILIENGYDGRPFTILSSNLSNMDKSALFIKDELEKIGLNVEVIIVDWSTMMAYRSDPNKYDLCITAMTSVPVPSLKLYFDPDYAGWSDDEHLQALLEKLNSSQTIEKALEVWKELQLYSFEYLPVIVAGHYNSGYLYRKELKGVIENNGFYFYNAYF